MVRLGGVNIKGIYLIHSPKVKNIVLVSKGSGNFRASLKHNWQRMSKIDAAKPKIRNRVMKNRTGKKLKEKSKIKRTMEYDKIKSDNVKRIINNL